MQRRDHLLEAVVKEIEDLARIDLSDPKFTQKEIEGWDLEGFWFLDLSTTIELYWAWKEHGVMPVSGGFLDQPVQWQTDMKLFRKLYATKVELVKKELGKT